MLKGDDLEQTRERIDESNEVGKKGFPLTEVGSQRSGFKTEL